MTVNPETTVIQMPPRNSKQEIVHMLKMWIEEAERGEIAGIAVTIIRPADVAADPNVSCYRWRPSWALAGALAYHAQKVLNSDD